MPDLTIGSHNQHSEPSHATPSPSPGLLPFLVRPRARALRRRNPSLQSIHKPRRFLLRTRPPTFHHLALRLHRRCRSTRSATCPPFVVRAADRMALGAAPLGHGVWHARDVARRRDL